MKCTFNGRKWISVVNFSPFLRENIFTLRENIFTLMENSVPQSENILPQTDRFLPLHFLYILRYFAKGKILSVWRTIFTKWKYYLFGGQYLPTNGFKFTFIGVIQLRPINRTWISTRTESDWGISTQTPFVWSLCGITSSENFNFFLCNSVKRNHICPTEGVLLTDGIFRKGTYGSDKRTFFSHKSVNGIQFSLCGTPTNLIFAHRVILIPWLELVPVPLVHQFREWIQPSVWVHSIIPFRYQYR